MTSERRKTGKDRRSLLNPEMNRLVEELNLRARSTADSGGGASDAAGGPVDGERAWQQADSSTEPIDSIESGLSPADLGELIAQLPTESDRAQVPPELQDTEIEWLSAADEAARGFESESSRPGAGADPGATWSPSAGVERPKSILPIRDARDVRAVDPAGMFGALLGSMARLGASDLLLVPDAEPMVRIDGQLRELADRAGRAVRSLAEADIRSCLAPHLDPEHGRALAEKGAADLTLTLDLDDGSRGASSRFRFRVNLHRQRGRLAAAIRCLPQVIPTLEKLNLPPSLRDLVSVHQGLILFCGPTGSGKSSTQAALVGQLNETRRCHILTIEQPVEYDHACHLSLIEHVEVGVDCPGFAEALRSALRQDPDVILVGEMRDLETIQTAITAAETGHLVLGTLHTHDAVQAIHRMVDVFPGESKNFIRHQLSMSLNAIVSQQLVPRSDGRGRVPAVEVLQATYPVRNHIRSGKLEKLYNELVLGQRHGMITLERSLAELVARGWIDEQEARVRSRRPEELDSLLRERGYSGNTSAAGPVGGT